MPRTRIIRPTFAQLPVTGRLTRDARLLFILLWPVVDDAGRLRLDWTWLREQLFPYDCDAEPLMPLWLDELEREECVERYSVDGVEYLRILGWKRLQTIDRPSRSHLPAAASESQRVTGAPRETREAREPREESPETSMRRASKGNPREAFFCEEGGSVGTRGITRDRVLADLDRLVRKAERDEVHTSAARYLELMGRHVGLWGGRGAPVGKKEPVFDGPTLEELHGRNPDGTPIAGT